MDAIGPTIEVGLLLESGREVRRGLGSTRLNFRGLQSVTESVSGSCQIQKHFGGVTDRHRLTFRVKFLLRGNSRLHPLRLPQNNRLRDVLSSPDRLHRMLQIRHQNRGIKRRGSTSGEPRMS
jgi:hypothetical protein